MLPTVNDLRSIKPRKGKGAFTSEKMYLYLLLVKKKLSVFININYEIKRTLVALDKERKNVGEVQLWKTKRKTTLGRRLMQEQRQKGR